MIDVKKFVVTFLILAALVSSLALVGIGINQGNSGPIAPAQPFSLETSGSNSKPAGNAFAPAGNSAAGSHSVSAGTAEETSDPNNLTSRLANNYLNSLVAANPAGPRDDGNGNQIVSAPGTRGIFASPEDSAAVASIQIPDWDFEADKIPVRGTDMSADQIAQYGNTLASIMNARFTQTNLQKIAQNTNGATPDDISYLYAQIQGSLNDISTLTPPKQLVDFQKSIIKVLVYEKNGLALAQNPSDDPLRTSLIFQAENEKYLSAIQNLQRELQNVSQNKIFASAVLPHDESPKGFLAFLNNVAGIQTAHAFYSIVQDPVTEAQTTLTVGQIIWQFVQSELLQILKNTLITLLQNKVLALIRNSGNPKFIQNWSGFLADTYNVAVGSALGQVVPGLCGNFSTDVTGWLKNTFPNSRITPGGFTLNGAPGTQCTLQTAINNIPSYYSDFSAGGFNAFGALLNPANNPFGAFAVAYDSVQAVANSQASGAQNKAIAGQGYKGQEFCDDGSQPNPNDGNVCDDGTEPIVTTPGTSLADTTGRAINSSIDLIVNANNITGVVGVVAGMMLQQVIAAGANGLLGAATAGTGSPPAPTPAVPPVTCNISQSVASTSASILFTASGGSSASNFSWSAPSGNPSTGTGYTFTTSFAAPGTYPVTVSGPSQNGTQFSTCTITIQ